MENMKGNDAQSGSQRPFKVGDKVWHAGFGHGVVTKNDIYGECIYVEFFNSSDRFFPDGKDYKSDIAPSLYHCGDIIRIPDAPEQPQPERRKLVRKDAKEFQPFDKVLVRNIEKTVWYPSFFGILGCKSKNYMTTSGMFYNDCIPFEGNEWACGRVTDEHDIEVL